MDATEVITGMYTSGFTRIISLTRLVLLTRLMDMTMESAVHLKSNAKTVRHSVVAGPNKKPKSIQFPNMAK